MQEWVAPAGDGQTTCSAHMGHVDLEVPYTLVFEMYVRSRLRFPRSALAFPRQSHTDLLHHEIPMVEGRGEGEDHRQLLLEMMVSCKAMQDEAKALEVRV